MKNHAFTLIELLVVVLIIGILSAIALPNYQRAVWKSRNTQFKQALRSISEAEQVYYLANGQYSADFSTLDLDFPATHVPTTANQNIEPCKLRVQGNDSLRETDSFQIILNSTNIQNGLWIVGVWKTGPYKCNGFLMFDDQTMQCFETRNGTSLISPGDFCVKLENAGNPTDGNMWTASRYSW